MSITNQITQTSTKEHGYLFVEACREDFEEGNRQLAFLGHGPHPYIPNQRDQTALIRGEALERPVPAYVEGSSLYYDSVADDRKLAETDVQLGGVRKWNGTDYDPGADNPGAINLVQPTGNGYRLSNLNPGNTQSLGSNGFRAHGQKWFNNYTTALKKLAAARQAKQGLMEDLASEDAEDPSEEALQAAEAEIQNRASTVKTLLTFIELAYDNSVVVNYDAEIFGATGQGDRSDRVAFLASRCREAIGIDAGAWQQSLRSEPEGETQGETQNV